MGWSIGMFSSKSSLKWYESLWAGLPIGLTAVGGAIGGACGGLALFINLRLMQSKRPGWQRYAMSGATSLVGVAAYVLFARLFVGSLNFGGAVTVEQVDRELSGKPMFAAIRKADPQDYDHIRDAVFDGAKRGRPKAEINSVMQTWLGAAVRKYLPLSADAAVLDFGRVYAIEIDQIAAKSVDDCVKFIYPQPKNPLFVGDNITAEVIAEENAIDQRIVETGASNPQSVPSREQVAASLNRIARALVEQFGAEEVTALGKPDTLSHERLCTLNRAFYKEILSLPRSEAVLLLRFLFAGQAA